MIARPANDNTPAAIVEIQEVLAEDNRSIVFYGHTVDDDVTFIASVVLPEPINPAQFSGREWLVNRSVGWRRA